MYMSTKNQSLFEQSVNSELNKVPIGRELTGHLKIPKI